jgi:hypothetical protein
MMISSHAAHPLILEDEDLACAWGRALVHVVDHPGTAISPLIISLTGFADGGTKEDPIIRAALDAALNEESMQSVHTVANTIFPQSLWRICGNDRGLLYSKYLSSVPRYRALAPSKNARGLYFERLIHFAPTGVATANAVNQLEFIITAFTAKKGVRVSMLQASVFDPTRDHTRAAQLGFPCLQHISFVPVRDGTLVVNAFYATQQLFDKAYGNYLGLCRLGHFMAGEMGLRLGRLNCFVGVAKLERVTKHATSVARGIAAIRQARGMEGGLNVLDAVASPTVR